MLQRLTAYFQKHPPKRAEVLGCIGFVVIVAVCAPWRGTRSEPIKSVARPPGAAAKRPPEAAGTVPATAPSNVASYYDNELRLYNPNQEEASPEWSLPAELKTEEVRSLVNKIELATQASEAWMKRQRSFDEHLGRMSAADVQNLLWQRLVKNGFRDARLPLDRYEVLTDHVGLGGIADMAGEVADAIALFWATQRLNEAKFQLLGGRAHIGDVLFIKAFQIWVEHKIKRLDRLEPRLEDVYRRFHIEFPGTN